MSDFLSIFKPSFSFGSSKSSGSSQYSNTGSTTNAPWFTDATQQGLTQLMNLIGNVPGMNWNGANMFAQPQPAQPNYYYAPTMGGDPYGGYTVGPPPTQTDPAFNPTGPSSFIAPFSTDTQAMFTAARNWESPADALRGLTNWTPESISQLIAAQAGPIQQYQAAMAQAAQAQASRAKDFSGAYFDPFINQVVDTTLANFDVGADRAANAMRAQRDASAAFGDRPAIADAVFAADAARNRAATEAGLRSDAFRFAGEMGAGDAGRFTSASLANAQMRNATDLANAAALNAQRNQHVQLNAVRDQFNAGQTNSVGQANAQIQQNNIANRQNDQRFDADALVNAGNADLTGINMLGTIGGMQDEMNQAAAQEPLQMWQLYFNSLLGIPYDTTTTESGTTTTRGRNSSFRFGIG